ncbi:MAG TPA: serine/threonine-protein kinase [Candidatus Nanopelagicales bacterium]|nr:serine/threonine-protein kinase [Candidatus Nanopelagicales bacterium]
MNGSSARERRPGVASGLLPGDTIGPYELLFRAAEGGMATIWAARRSGSRGFQQIVAVKVLSDLLREDPDGRAMFLDEARTAARIIHPNVGQVLDYGEDTGRPYMAMEWIEGESLARFAAARRAQGGRLPLRWVLRVAADACAGLHAAHEAHRDDGEPMGLVHRDISPQNVMVTWSGITKVVDFGVAKSRGRAHVTRVGVIKGKTGYFSPEQIAGREIDRRSDIFSFGVLLYVLVTDHHPFRGRSAMETVQNIARREPFSPREIAADLPPALDALIMRALAKDPGERFATAAELGRALELCTMTLAPGSHTDPLEEEAAPSRRPLSDRVVGAVARAIMPDAEPNRRTRLSRSAALLDEVWARAQQGEQAATEITLMEMGRGRLDEPERSKGSGIDATFGDSGIDVTFDDSGIDVALDEVAHRDGPASRTPQGTSIAALPLPPRARRGRTALGLMPALMFLGALAITTHAGERLGVAPVGIEHAARAGAALTATRAAAQAHAAVIAAENAAVVVEEEAKAEANAAQVTAVPASDARLPPLRRGAPRPVSRGGAARSTTYEPRGL